MDESRLVIVTMPDGSTFDLEMTAREIRSLMSLTWDNDRDAALVEAAAYLEHRDMSKRGGVI